MLRDSDLLVGRALGARFTRENRTERDVCVPPALIITDRDGKTFTFGFSYNNSGEINVLVNDRDTGEFAEKIDFAKGVVTLYGSAGKRRWTGRSFV